MNEIKKILIIRFSSIGDILLASPLIRVLRNAFPEANIDFIIKSEYADLVKFDPNLSSIIELRSNDKNELKELKNTLYKTQYDVVIDIHNSLRSRYLRWLCGARYVRVVNKRIIRRFFLVKFKWNFYTGSIQVADRYIETMEKFGISNDGKGLEITIPEETLSTVKAMMGKYRLERYDKVIGMAPSARHFTKRWLPERFVELGAEIAQKFHAKIFIFGSKTELDYCGDIAQMINANLGSAAAESFAGKLNLLETAVVLDNCSLVISNDSSIMHLAAARKKKIVAIFGSTVKEFGFFPYGTENIVVENETLQCRPCSHIGLEKCPRNHFRCMKDIPVDDVLKAIQTMLGS
jgi:lipopolysaccharide heptosyltransferase II